MHWGATMLLSPLSPRSMFPFIYRWKPGPRRRDPVPVLLAGHPDVTLHAVVGIIEMINVHIVHERHYIAQYIVQRGTSEPFAGKASLCPSLPHRFYCFGFFTYAVWANFYVRRGYKGEARTQMAHHHPPIKERDYE